MLPSQIILSALILFIIYKTINSYRKNKLSKIFFAIWSMFWFGMLFVILNTKILSFIAGVLKIGRGVDVAIYISIIVIFYLIYKIYLLINSLEKKMTEIVRKQALDNQKKSKPSK